MKNVAESRMIVMRLLATLPVYRRWRNRPIKPDLQQWIERADAQELMTAGAAILARLSRMK